MNHRNVLFRIHAVQRMFERRVSMKSVLRALESGETVEDYSGDSAEPARLLLGFQGKQPIHVVCSENLQANQTVLITVYLPDPSKWHPDFKRRRS